VSIVEPSLSGASARWLCPACEDSPAIGADANDPVCPQCGTRLVQLTLKEEDDLVGQVIDGRFEILAFLGAGAMGTVYRARQKSIGREVAIKMIDKQHGRDEMAVRRFLREARLASQLSQPNTVSVLDVGQAKDGRLFLAMELIRGKTLDEVVAREGAFSAARAAHIGIQLCDALEAAARLQIVHRDLKPANVIVLDDPPGRDLLKVLDFGLAKSLIGDESEATQSGLIVGTPRYMAPEVLMGAPHTLASDLYAVGVILGEISTGSVMWPTNSLAVLLANKFDGSPLTAKVPAPLRPIVARLISADPARRYASAVEVRDALVPVKESRADTDSGPSPAASVPELVKVSFLAAPSHAPLPPATSAADAARPPTAVTTRDQRPTTPSPRATTTPGGEAAAATAAKPKIARQRLAWNRRTQLALAAVLAVAATVLIATVMMYPNRRLLGAGWDDEEPDAGVVEDEGTDQGGDGDDHGDDAGEESPDETDGDVPADEAAAPADEAAPAADEAAPSADEAAPSADEAAAPTADETAVPPIDAAP
jgi:serine/threonine-protein kinase